MFNQLATTEIEQFAPFDGPPCPSCGTARYRLLDESRLTIPIDGYIEHFLRVHYSTRIVVVGGNRFTTLSEDSVIPSLVYEIRNDLVRSGVFSREQLSGLHFTQHELEVNDRSFLDLRPVRCDCDFGEPELSEYELSLLVPPSEGSTSRACRLNEPEAAFVAGNPVRTGFRLRSTEARKRRAARKAGLRVPLVVSPKLSPLVKEGSSYVTSISRTSVELSFNYRPRKGRDGISSSNNTRKRYLGRLKYRLSRKQVSDPLVIRSLNGSFAKYCYFARKNGFAYRSVHHPLQGDLCCLQQSVCSTGNGG